LFTVLRWADLFGLDIARFGALRAFIARVGARPAVEQALAAEGLLKQAA
jgi:glutathione S-transferase